MIRQIQTERVNKDILQIDQPEWYQCLPRPWSEGGVAGNARGTGWRGEAPLWCSAEAQVSLAPGRAAAGRGLARPAAVVGSGLAREAAVGWRWWRAITDSKEPEARESDLPSSLVLQRTDKKKEQDFWAWFWVSVFLGLFCGRKEPVAGESPVLPNYAKS